MSLLSNLKPQDDVKGEEKDSVGGGRPVYDSGIYAGTIKLAYLQKSKGGALGLFLTIETDDGKEITQAMYVTGGDSKGNKHYYEKDGEKFYLPGFNMANSLSMLTAGVPLFEVETETKTIALYNYEAKGEVPTKVEVATGLMNKRIYVGLIKQEVQKTAKNEATGQYDPIDGTRFENDIDKFFCAHDAFDKMTTSEIMAKKQDDTVVAAFYDTWDKANTGKVRDKTGGGKAKAGAPSAGKPAAAGGKPTSSLFA